MGNFETRSPKTIFKSFLFKLLNKEVLIFVFFLLLSSFFWLLTTLNETYEKELHVPVHITGVPQNLVLTTNETDTLRVTLRDRGFALASYWISNKIQPLQIAYQTYAKYNGQGTVPTSDLQRKLTQQLAHSTKIVSIKPEKLMISSTSERPKRVPIELSGIVTAANSYRIAHIRFKPDSIEIYGDKSKLNTIKSVRTKAVKVVDFEEKVMLKACKLASIHGVKLVLDTVNVEIIPEILTEQVIDVPITVINVPSDKILRTFPSRVKVRYVIGSSSFRAIGAEHFKVIVDYNDIKHNVTDKCKVRLQSKPAPVVKVQIETQEVDYLIEKKAVSNHVR